MTNEEASFILANIDRRVCDDELSDALDMAIKALEAQPCEDCISRQEAINSLGECPMVWTDSDAEITAERDWKYTVKMLKSLPTVTPQPKTGRWMAIPIPEGTTNADMIKAIFPDVKVKEKNNGYEVYFGVGTAIQFFNHQWWNAPYKAESEDKE